MKWMHAAVFPAFLSAGLVVASEEDIAPWTSITFKCRPMNSIPETTVAVEAEGSGISFRLKSVRISNSEIDVQFPKEAIGDVERPKLETAQLLVAASRRGGPPSLIFSVESADANPRQGAERTFVQITVEFGKVTGRARKIMGPKGVRYEDMPVRRFS